MGYYMSRGGNYANPMDREYSASSGYNAPSGGVSKAQEQLDGLSLKYIGGTTNPTQHQLEQLKKKIFVGAQKVELGFMGQGKGYAGQGQWTPESYGIDERKAMKELSQMNEIELSVHAAVGATGFAGLTNKGFSDENQEQTLHEVQRAINFAADVAEGGAVVVHLGELPRDVAGTFKEFRMYEGEEKKGQVYLANKETGEIIPLKKDMEITIPVKNDNGEYEFKKDGTIKTKPLTYQELAEKTLKEHPDWNSGQVAKEFYIQFRRNQVEEQRGMMKRWRHDREQAQDQLKEIEKHEEEIKKNTAHTEEEKKEALEKINIQKKHIKSQYDYAINIEAETQVRIEQIENDMHKVVPLEKLGLDRTADSLAKSGMYAMEQQKQNNLKKDLFVAPENIFPEQMGGHPQELKEIIIASRKKMAEELKKRGTVKDEKEGMEIASKHIKATFDIGHANVWKKYFRRKEGHTDEQHDAEFNKWLLGQVEDLSKAGIIGHVHITDNLGWNDEHLDVGQGTAPIKDFVNTIKKFSKEQPDIIIETAQQDYKAMLSGWRFLGVEMGDSLAQEKWGDIENSYFGHASSPPYFLGESRPPSEDWNNWSGTPLE